MTSFNDFMSSIFKTLIKKFLKLLLRPPECDEIHKAIYQTVDI